MGISRREFFRQMVSIKALKRLSPLPIDQIQGLLETLQPNERMGGLLKTPQPNEPAPMTCEEAGLSLGATRRAGIAAGSSVQADPSEPCSTQGIKHHLPDKHLLRPRNAQRPSAIDDAGPAGTGDQSCI